MLRYYRSLLWWFLGLVMLMGLSVGVGARETAFLPVVQVLPSAWDFALHPLHHPLLREQSAQAELAILIGGLRIPRTLLAPLAGACLGVAGAILQGHTRNPLADPSLVGIHAGAAVAVVLSALLLPGASPVVLTLAAIGGALVVSSVVFLVAFAGGFRHLPLTLLLAGTAISALLMAVVHGLILIHPQALDAFRTWATGSVTGASMQDVAVLAVPAIIGLFAALVHMRSLDVIGLGDAQAQALGARVTTVRLSGLLIVALLGGAAVAGAGAVPFVGLAAPHVARLLYGASYPQVVPYSMMIGAVAALIADMLARFVLAPAELPMGTVLAVLGAPLFIALVRTTSKELTQ
ncbi:FecCD family ABC transporter permease [Corynebacterium choanae]|uniref:Putative siderophore transport system permease protein YfhA n=1 Tax=Corynebacterium choanae TaxID=1862358 RepID=A0A3G6J7D8_9CORY|nr:iron ABC transporter permease [Corynebacterium choanae]AZA14031.1 putative siderophore transport system permease protein YfhA [Corynebacterium choanae]